MRRPIVAGNWKMNLGPADGAALAHALRRDLTDAPTRAEVIVFPPMLTVGAVAQALKGTDLAFGVQHLHPASKGAFTGEISVAMASEVGCSWALAGHSERRKLFGLDDAGVNERVKAILRGSRMSAMVCVGETLDDRERGDTMKVVARQVAGGLAGLSENELGRVALAYEPVWAIGTGRTATPQQAQEVHADVRALLSRQWGDGVARSMRILYGGSVKPANVDALMACPDIDGALVGGASLKADSFARIVRFQSA